VYVFIVAAAASSSTDDNSPTSRHWRTTTTTTNSATTTNACSERRDQLTTTTNAVTTTTTKQHPTGFIVARPRSFPGNGSVAATTDSRPLHVAATKPTPYDPLRDCSVTAADVQRGTDDDPGAAGPAGGVRTQSGPDSARDDPTGSSRRRRDAADTSRPAVALRRPTLATANDNIAPGRPSSPYIQGP